MDNRSKSSRLERYIRTHGTTLPMDLEHYRMPQGDKRSLCVFCDSPHDYHPILQREHVSRQDAAATVVVGVFTCDKCDHIIESSIDMNVSEDYAIEKLLRKERENRRAAISLYIREGLFPMAAHLHYQHLYPNEEMYKDNLNQDRCVFCKKKIQKFTPETYYKIEVPVGVDVYHLDGGAVVTCDECLDEIHEIVPEISFDGWIVNTFEKDNCLKCGQTYLVTNGEAEMRGINKTIGKYLCPKCAYENLIRSGDDAFFYHRCNSTDGRLLRYIDVGCSFCKEQMGVDQMLAPAHLLKEHVTPDGKVVCNDCKYEGRFPIAASRGDAMVWMFFYDEPSGKALAVKRSIITGIVKHFEVLGSMSELLDIFRNIEDQLDD